MTLTDYAAYQSILARTTQRYARYKSAAVNVGSLLVDSYKSAQDVGATPTTAANLDAATAGSLLPPITATGTPRLAQVELAYASTGGGVFALFDRLSHNGGLSGIVTTAQTCNVGPNSRWTDYSKVVAFLEVYSNVGTTASTITVSYTNESGTSGRTSPVMPFGGTGYRAAQGLIAIPLQEGDVGFKSVESVTINTLSTGTTGNFGVTLARLVTLIPVTLRQQSVVWDGVDGGSGNLPDVTNMYPMFVYQYAGTGGDLLIDMRFIDG